ncbi:hypothetical protein pb186bvf_012903 [Paramecium bursaria]
MVNILHISFIQGKSLYLNYETTAVVDTFEEYGDIINYELWQEKNLSQCYFQRSQYQIKIIDKIKVLIDVNASVFEQYFLNGKSNFTQQESIIGLINITEGIIVLTSHGSLQYIKLDTKSIQMYKLNTPILDKAYIHYYQRQITIIADLTTIVVSVDFSKDYIFLWNNQATHIFQLNRVLKICFVDQMIYLLLITNQQNFFKLLSYKIYGGSFEYIDMKDITYANDMSVQQQQDCNHIYIINNITGIYQFVHNQTNDNIEQQESEYLLQLKGHRLSIFQNKLIIANQLNDHSFQVSLFLVEDLYYKIVNITLFQGKINDFVINFDFILINTQNSQYIYKVQYQTIALKQIFIQLINFPKFNQLIVLNDTFVGSSNKQIIQIQYKLNYSKLVCYLEQQDQITLNLNSTLCPNQQLQKFNKQLCQSTLEYQLNLRYPIIQKQNLNIVIYMFATIITFGLLIIVFTLWYYLRYLILRKKFNMSTDETVIELKSSSITFNQLMNSNNVSIPNLTSNMG